MSTRKDRQSAFSRIYDTAYWGAEHLSGMGSTVEATAPVRAVVERVVVEHDIRSVTDVACGDMVWMPLVLERLRERGHPVAFTGCDIVALAHRAAHREVPRAAVPAAGPRIGADTAGGPHHLPRGAAAPAGR